MRMPAWTLAALLVSSAGSAQAPPKKWAQEPTAYRGVPFGAPMVEAREKLRFGAKQCKPAYGQLSKLIPGTTSCYLHGSLEVGRVRVSETLTFAHDRLAGVAMHFEANDFDSMKAVFLEKYGPPTSETKTPVSNKMGAVFQNEELEWQGPSIRISMTRFVNTLDNSMASLDTVEFDEEYLRRAKEEREKAKKAF
jgi:hypothetical protein